MFQTEKIVDKIYFGEAAFAVLLAGVLCLLAIGVTFFIRNAYPKNNNDSFVKNYYECGFDIKSLIIFDDSKQGVIPYFLLLESIALWIVAIVIFSVCHHVTMHNILWYGLLIVIMICIMYFQKYQSNINGQ